MITKIPAKIKLSFLLILPLLLFSADYKPIILSDEHQHDIWGTMPRDQIKKFRAFTVSFDGKDDSDLDGDEDEHDKFGQPEWVAYHIKKGGNQGKAPNRPSPWIEDKALAELAPSDDTYKHSGYSRGHLCMKKIAWRLGANADWNTHTTLNACPQIQGFNSGIWLDMEYKTASWADKYNDVWVICGPAWIKSKDVTYIGDENEMKIPIPHFFWKIVIKKSEEKLDSLAFLYPHKAIGKSKDSKSKYRHEDYLVSVNEIEEVTGLDFFTNLDDEKEDALEGEKADAIWE